MKYALPSSHIIPRGTTWGRPSGLVVASQVVWRFGPPVSGAWVEPSSSRWRTRSHSMIGASYPSRFFSEVGSVMVVSPRVVVQGV